MKYALILDKNPPQIYTRGMNFKKKAVVFIATGFFIGKIPFAPGTFGSIPGLLLAFMMSCLDFSLAAFFMAFFIPAAIWISGKAESILKAKDPGQIVIDEMAGMGVALMGLPFNLQTAVWGFFLFRFFDILKPFPIKRIERKLPGGAGIVMDDVLAGLFANTILRIVF
ncbi:Phosphatidylglycerophosphatase A [Candidatus Desulfarcum epimagneticum]|uniref:Phosphatidylglycerophosphatase A n=1 Tax=uncultured Desulfobacteraceae bacterium TaxID=218296 RepID=A0A484HHG2_9BACT|nr:Phosphatidylglycerophosphatase A [uncultured Desulfobacteraceae bacterium]